MNNHLKELTIEITQKCPNACLFCSSYSHRDAKHFLSYSDAERVGKQSVSLGLTRIAISGGEPLFHPDIVNISNFFNDIGLHTAIYTTGISRCLKNGSRAYKEWDQFNKRGVTLIFNIQSTERTIHDKLTRHIGSFEKTINSLKASLDFGMDVETHIVPNKLNINSLEDTVKELISIGVQRISFLRLVSQGNAKENAHFLELNHRESENLKKIFLLIKKEHENSKLRFGVPFSGLLNSPKPCNAGECKLIIRYDGKVLPCEAFKDKSFDAYVLGDIRKDSLTSILKNGHSHNGLMDLKNQTTILESCPAQLLYCN
jgi:radical SAM protein with 4Fe4S-binding SPASM domain